MNIGLKELHAMNPDTCRALFIRICGSPAWSKAMTNQRPYCCVDGLLTIAVDTWRGMQNRDKRDAIMHHPRIGDTVIDEREYDETERKFIAQEASHKGKKPMGKEIRAQFVKLNDDYFHKFGYVYVVSAFGKSDEEMLSLLKRRLLSLDAEQEFQTACDEEEKVLVRRLGELFKDCGSQGHASSSSHQIQRMSVSAAGGDTSAPTGTPGTGSRCWNRGHSRTLRSRL